MWSIDLGSGSFEDATIILQTAATTARVECAGSSSQAPATVDGSQARVAVPRTTLTSCGLTGSAFRYVVATNEISVQGVVDDVVPDTYLGGPGIQASLTDSSAPAGAPALTISPESGPIGTVIAATIEGCRAANGVDARVDFSFEDDPATPAEDGTTPAASEFFTPDADGSAVVEIIATEKSPQSDTSSTGLVVLSQCEGGGFAQAAFVVERGGGTAVPTAGTDVSEADIDEDAYDGQTTTMLAVPSPDDALTLKNVALAALLTILLLLLVVFPSTIFNNTIEANMDTIRGWVPSWLRRRSPALTAADGDGAAADGVSFWHTWQGFAVYVLAAGLLYSLMQPGWGWNRGTALTLLSFLLAIVVGTLTAVTIVRAYMRRRYGETRGHIEVTFATLAFAIVCVVASRVASFIPGYFYGVIASYVMLRTPSDDDSGRMVRRTVVVTFVFAIGAWLLLIPLDEIAEGGSVLEQLPRSLSAGLVTGGVEALVIGLVPLTFLPGNAVMKWNRKVWVTCYAAACSCSRSSCYDQAWCRRVRARSLRRSFSPHPSRPPRQPCGGTSANARSGPPARSTSTPSTLDCG